jgi:hypothetical protein
MEEPMMNRLRRLILGMMGMLALALLAAAAPAPTPAMAAEGGDLLYYFEGTVRKGPSKGTELAGELKLRPAEDGTVVGALTVANGTEIGVSGRLSNGNLSVAFDLGELGYVFGIGQADQDGEFEGSFIGPGEGDSGKWEATPITKATFDFSGTVTRGPSEGTTISGELALTIDNEGDFTGALTVDEATVIPVRGELDDDGAEIEVVFLVSDTVRIRGQGDATEDGGFAGSFRGPQPGDRGEWIATPSTG